ncbi:MAG: DNA/RNA nuclease SfsA [Alphaproteobacteria bacterium]
MRWSKPLVQARLVRRYKRFLADAELTSGETVTAHCANPGAMTGLAEPGSEIWLAPAASPKRRLDWSWELVRVAPGPRGLVGINTSRPNLLVEEAIAGGHLEPLTGYDHRQREVRYGRNSRIDFLLSNDDRPPCYVEVKNVHLRRDGVGGMGLAEFPDSVTARGAKHLDELADVARAGGRAVMLYVIQRADCGQFALATDIDPTYSAAFTAARRAGVEAYAWACKINLKEVRMDGPIALAL